MNNATEMKATPGLLKRVQEQAGIQSDPAFARLLNVSPVELEGMRRGDEVSIRGLVGIAAAFGTPLREIVTMVGSKGIAA
ncbi:hypothetical protein J2Y69_002475 [Microbacterium resistens]|uniref:HTH cro/C1-type domain-containing protein n=1 Tax=Microbacterium resistens TaxID=156977 RepID=A0ABU1SE26_9MICO|nr:hypothetical protein [Microbacterium resistens]MDR6867867.1 hypothetical protein [Microbacterium resistens]